MKFISRCRSLYQPTIYDTLQTAQTICPTSFFANSLLILFVVLVGSAFFLFFETSKPIVNISAIPKYIGKTNTLEIETTDTSSGLRQIVVTATQGENVKELSATVNPRQGYTGQIGPLSDRRSVTFNAAELGFTEGPLTIAVTAYDFSMMGFFKGNRAMASTDVILDSRPPVVKILHSEQYITPGGAGIVIYSLEENEGRHGVVINGKFNPGYPVGGEKHNVQIAYFALPYDAETLTESHILATDVAGNAAMLPFSVIVQKAQQKHDRINISDGFLSTKIPEFEQYYPNMPGNLVEKYLYTNETIRDQNNLKIAELCSTSGSERLWDGRFERMPGSNRAGFADHRTYYYNEQPIDKQVHLGMDIASTQQADVTAANKGRVVFADYLGIYGNMVLLDHGQGIFSLYSHLSQINAKVGDIVTASDSIGLTGTSGMAGGDHLHFSMLVNGIFVSPLEWWDPHWLEVTIERPLAAVTSK